MNSEFKNAIRKKIKNIAISGKLKMQKASFILLFVFACVLEIPAQNFQWARSFGSNQDEKGNAVCVDAAGNIYSTGTFKGTVDFDPGPGINSLSSVGNSDVFVQKMDANGMFLWARTFGGTSGEIAGGIGLDASGNVYTTGNYAGSVDFDPGPGTDILTSVGVSNVFIQKMDANGNYVWARSFGSSYGAGAAAIAMDASGNIHITGTFRGTGDFDPGPGTTTLTSISNSTDIFIQKMDANGNFLWAKSMGSNTTDLVYAITLDAAGNVHTTGTFHNAVDFDPGLGVYTLIGNTDVFVQKLDQNGNFIWARAFSGDMSDYCYAIKVDLSGNVYTTGYYTGTVDFNPGPAVYNKTSVAGEADIFIHKMDANGNFLWARSFGDYYPDSGLGISIDAAGNIYTVGWFYHSIDFDPLPGVYVLTAVGIHDVFIQKMDPAGHFLWAGQLGGGSSDWGTAITTDVSGNIYIIGHFAGTADFDPGPAVYNLTGNGLGDVFVQKMCFPTLPVNTTAGANLIICEGDSTILSATGNGLVWYSDSVGGNYMGAGNVFTTPILTDTTTFYVFDTTQCSLSRTGITVNVIPSSITTTSLSICANQTPYSWNAQSLDSTGFYTAIFTGMNGCDSIANLNLTVSPCIVCVPDFTINYSPFYNSLTESQSWIITSGTVLIEAGTQVKLDAHQTSYVKLNPGYKVDSGAVFVAQAYNGCTAGAPQLPQERKIANADLITNNEIVLYPNPTSGMIHIRHEEKLSNIQIFDMVGKLMINQKCHGETETNIDLSNLPNGVYHVKAAGYNSIKVVKND
jgi:hypothetical protein